LQVSSNSTFFLQKPSWSENLTSPKELALKKASDVVDSTHVVVSKYRRVGRGVMRTLWISQMDASKPAVAKQNKCRRLRINYSSIPTKNNSVGLLYAAD